MRYDTPIYFQSIQSGEYDATTGNHGADVVTETQKYASVTDSGAQTLQLIYGKLLEGSKTIRMQRPYTQPFDRIRIDGKTYRVDFSRHQRSFVVSEVQ